METEMEEIIGTLAEEMKEVGMKEEAMIEDLIEDSIELIEVLIEDLIEEETIEALIIEVVSKEEVREEDGGEEEEVIGGAVGTGMVVIYVMSLEHQEKINHCIHHLPIFITFCI